MLLRQAAGLEKGSPDARASDIAGSVTMAQVEEIAKIKMPDLNANDLEAAKLQVAGTARSMGLTVSRAEPHRSTTGRPRERPRPRTRDHRGSQTRGSHHGARQEVHRRDASATTATSCTAPTEALDLVKQLAPAKFDETVELAVRLGVDPRKADQIVRGTVALPAGTGKDVRVAVFAAGDAAAEARAAGADIVGADDLAAQVEGGMLDFDVAIATPDLMPMVGQLGRVLGPRGLMPNPKTGTVTTDVGKAVRTSRAARSSTAPTATATSTCPLGKVSFEPEPLDQNFRAVHRRAAPGQAGLGQGPLHPQGRACPPPWAPASRSTRPAHGSTRRATSGRWSGSLARLPQPNLLAEDLRCASVAEGPRPA